MADSRDLAKIADLLSLNALGVLQVDAIGFSAMLAPRFLRRTLPDLEPLCWEREPSISVVPRKSTDHDLHAPSSIIWARTESGPAAAKLRAFRPLPDVVVREGSTVRYVAFWALLDGLVAYQVEDANKRLAKFLNNGSYATAAADFTFHLPGTIVRVGRRRGHELPVELVRFEPAVHTLEAVVGRLPDPPTDIEKRELFEAALERKAMAEQRRRVQLEREADAAARIGRT